MAHARSWRLFRRMQHTLIVVAGLIYAVAALEAWRRVPWRSETLELLRTAVFPGAFLVVSVVLILFVPAVSRLMTAHLWTSYRTGYGQSVISVLAGVGLILLLAGVMFWRIAGAAHGGRDPAGALTAFAAGLGLLIAQAVLLRRIEADPQLGRLIEE
jgi:hypothetical protein